MTNKDITLTHVMTSRDIMSWLSYVRHLQWPTRNCETLIDVSNYHKLSKVLSCLRIAEKLQCFIVIMIIVQDLWQSEGDWTRDPADRTSHLLWVLVEWHILFANFVQSILFVSQCPQRKCNKEGFSICCNNQLYIRLIKSHAKLGLTQRIVQNNKTIKVYHPISFVIS